MARLIPFFVALAVVFLGQGASAQVKAPDPDAPYAKPKPEVKPPFKPEIKLPVKPEVKPPVKPPIKPEVKPPVKPELRPPVKPEVRPPVRPPDRPELRPPVKPEVRPPVRPPVKPEVGPTIKPEVRPRVMPSIKPKVKPAVEPQVKPPVRPGMPGEPFPPPPHRRIPPWLIVLVIGGLGGGIAIAAYKIISSILDGAKPQIPPTEAHFEVQKGEASQKMVADKAVAETALRLRVVKDQGKQELSAAGPLTPPKDERHER